MPHDLLLKGGTLIDPSQSIHDDLDVAFTDGKVSSVARGISDSEARDVYDASGLIVTPGLIDLHAHAFWGASEPGLPPDPVNVAKGVTTIVDAGSSGARTFPAFRKWTIERSATRIYALLNISAMGMPAGNKIGELLDMRWADVDEAIESWRANKEYIIGIKARLGRVQCLDSPVEALRRSLEVAEEIGGFVMIHVGNTATPLEELCAMLRPGDVVTHSFCGFEDVLIDGSGRVREGFKEAAGRGVVFDVGHGGGGFSFINAERAMADGLPPGNISTDLHQGSIDGPVYDMATTMTKFMHLGMSVDEVVRLTTQSTAEIMGMADRLGTLAVGAEGDAALLRLAEGRFPLVDRMGGGLTFHSQKWAPPVRVEATQRLEHVDTVRGGRLYRPWLE